MSPEEISVIMPVFNAGDGAALSEAVGSILSQEGVSLRLYICDDGSTDGTQALLSRLAREDDRITLITNASNLSAGAARNRCLAQARGEFVALMDSDDFSAPQRLRKQRDYLNSRPDLSFVGTRGSFFTRTPGDTEESYWFVRKPEKKDFLMTLPFVHASVMFRRSALDAVGGYCEEAWALRSEDYDLMMRLYSQGLAGENLDESLYFIRMDEDTYRRRKYKFRINEVRVKWRGFSRLGLFPKGVPYALKPLAVGLMPKGPLDRLKAAYYKDR